MAWLPCLATVVCHNRPVVKSKDERRVFPDSCLVAFSTSLLDALTAYLLPSWIWWHISTALPCVASLSLSANLVRCTSQKSSHSPKRPTTSACLVSGVSLDWSTCLILLKRHKMCVTAKYNRKCHMTTRGWCCVNIFTSKHLATMNEIKYCPCLLWFAILCFVEILN